MKDSPYVSTGVAGKALTEKHQRQQKIKFREDTYQLPKTTASLKHTATFSLNLGVFEE